MGICLDTDKKNETEELEVINGRSLWLSGNGRNPQFPATPSDGQFLSQNEGHVKFEIPKIPVVFVLGGPGSGKVTHCDNLAEEKRGIIHINMTDLLQQYTIGSGETKDFNQLSSKTVAEVLMLEMKMSPAAKTFLISGYPRNMRDVVEYTDKIKAVSGVIVLSWKRNSLEKQIEYGAKLGHVVLSLARMELNNFYKNVVPVADFYDQRKMLTSINGERNPAEVYNDFRAAILRIIGSQDAEKNEINKVIPNGKVIPSQPETIVAPSTSNDNSVSVTIPENSTTIKTITTAAVHNSGDRGFPSTVFVIGGPGSNKGPLIQRTIRRLPGWIHISIGSLLRAKVADREVPIELAQKIRDTIAAGELVDKEIVYEILDQAMQTNINVNGLIIDGFPRDMESLQYFESKYIHHPPMVLLDCSKLLISRGRWDDSIGAFRRRLEIFREKTLPLLKALDSEHRLTMVDGDTDTPEVQESFTISLFDAIQNAQELAFDGEDNRKNENMNLEAAILQDLEDEMLDNLGNKPQMNGFGPPRDYLNNGQSSQGNNVVSVSHATGSNNRSIPRGNILQTHAQVESYPQ